MGLYGVSSLRTVIHILLPECYPCFQHVVFCSEVARLQSEVSMSSERGEGFFLILPDQIFYTRPCVSGSRKTSRRNPSSMRRIRSARKLAMSAWLCSEDSVLSAFEAKGWQNVTLRRPSGLACDPWAPPRMSDTSHWDSRSSKRQSPTSKSLDVFGASALGHCCDVQVLWGRVQSSALASSLHVQLRISEPLIYTVAKAERS